MRILIFLVVLFISKQTLGQISSPNIEDYGKLPNISLMVVSPDAKELLTEMYLQTKIYL